MPLKYLSNFRRTLDILLIDCKVSLILTWFKNCVITSKAKRDADPDTDPPVPEINNPCRIFNCCATFKIKDTNLYVPVVTLSTQDDNKL